MMKKSNVVGIDFGEERRPIHLQPDCEVCWEVLLTREAERRLKRLARAHHQSPETYLQRVALDAIFGRMP